MRNSVIEVYKGVTLVIHTFFLKLILHREEKPMKNNVNDSVKITEVVET